MSNDKPKFFDRLYDLDRLADEDGEESSEAESFLEKGKNAVRAGHFTEATPVATMPEPGLERRKKAARAGRLPEPSRTKSKPLPPPLERPIVGRRVSTEKQSSSKGTKTALGKRKKEEPLQMEPESRQIFKGFNFFFIPESDISPVRRLRIRKSMEYGATWMKEWTDGITHVIADNHLTYQDIVKHLRIPSIPETVTLVNENYTLECIKYRLLVDPTHAYFQVDRGSLDQRGGTTSSDAQSSADHSLRPKPAKRRNKGPRETPPRNTELGEGTLAQQLPRNPLQQPAFSAGITEQATNDAMNDAIEEARNLKHLPIDTDDEDEVPSQLPADRDTDDEETEAPLKKFKGEGEPKNNTFQCMHKHDGHERETNPNVKTIAILQEMSDYYTRIRDTWRPIAYRKAIATLRKQDHKITTAGQAIKLPFIGSRLALKIEEIVWTNRLRRLENAKLDDSDKLLEKFLGIYGVGFSQASKWISQGYQSLDDLLLQAQLTDNQKIGIEHYEDFQNRIPRAEVEEHENIVTSTAQSIDPQLQVAIMGSYRRGSETCGDIDLMITKTGASVYELRNILLDELIPSLFAQDFLQVGLAMTSKTAGTKWHGASRLPKRDGAKWRRIDFLLVPTEEMGAALIYFTGNDIFNRSIRLLASKKGMRLNQHGLWKDVIRGQNRERITQGTLLEGKSERRIFEVLGVPYRPPEHRNC